MIDAVVVGGGLSGLAAATRLRHEGRSVQLLDAGEAPGGNIQSRTVETAAGRWLLELGPNAFGEGAGGMLETARLAGLESELVRAPDLSGRRLLFCDGRLVEIPTSPVGFLRSPILPLGGRLRMLREPFVKRRPVQAPEETLADFCDRRLGIWVRRRLLTPFVGGVYAGDPARLGAESAFPRLVAAERNQGSLFRAARAGAASPARGRLCSFVNGLATLPTALAKGLGDAYRPRTPVEAVGRDGARWTVSANGERARTPNLVLATPAGVTATLLRNEAPVAADELSAIEYAPMVVIHVGVPRDRLMFLPQAFGFLVPRGEGVRVLGAIFSSLLFPGRAPAGYELLTVFMGGALDPHTMAASDDEISEWVLGDLAETLGLRGEPAFLGVTRWPRAIPQYAVGHAARLGRIEAARRSLPGLHLLGNWGAGIAMHDCVARATEVVLRAS